MFFMLQTDVIIRFFAPLKLTVKYLTLLKLMVRTVLFFSCVAFRRRWIINADWMKLIFKTLTSPQERVAPLIQPDTQIQKVKVRR